jgi:quinol monooxygenase YgiN
MKTKLISGVCALMIGLMLTTIIRSHGKSPAAVWPDFSGKRTTHVRPDPTDTTQRMMVRISEIEILPAYLDEYMTILKTEAAASVEKEPGVLAIFPMRVKEQPTQIRIVEIYADSSAYQSHLKTAHFLQYKTSTLKMVKSLKLVDMQALDPDTMAKIFKKLK